MMNAWHLLAQAASSAAEGQPAGPSGLEAFLPFIAIGLLMFFLIFMPERKKEKEKQRQLSQIKKNDKIITMGGVHGVVYAVKDDVLIIKVDEERDVKLTISRTAVASVTKQGESKSTDPSPDKNAG